MPANRTDEGFFFVVCQVGSDAVCKRGIAKEYPDAKLSFSRPGFMTFKHQDVERVINQGFQNAFVRTYGRSIGHVTGEEAHALAREFWDVAASYPAKHLHVWQRDRDMPGNRGFEPGETLLAAEIGKELASRRPIAGESPPVTLLNQVTAPDDVVLDCMLVDPTDWWIGVHRATSMPRRWPGGVPKISRPEEALSRAYWKMNEAVLWSQIPIKEGDECLELGSSPGGASQFLLECGLHVLGVDPAEMDPSVTEHPNFEHLRKRGAELKKRDLRSVRWLFADSNVPPEQTLETVEGIVKSDHVNIRGLLLTLKFSEWSMADHIPAYLQRIRSWGFQYVKPRQLAYNRQEICLFALKNKAMRRF